MEDIKLRDILVNILKSGILCPRKDISGWYTGITQIQHKLFSYTFPPETRQVEIHTAHRTTSHNSILAGQTELSHKVGLLRFHNDLESDLPGATSHIGALN